METELGTFPSLLIMSLSSQEKEKKTQTGTEGDMALEVESDAAHKNLTITRSVLGILT